MGISALCLVLLTTTTYSLDLSCMYFAREAGLNAFGKATLYLFSFFFLWGGLHGLALNGWAVSGIGIKGREGMGLVMGWGRWVDRTWDVVEEGWWTRYSWLGAGFGAGAGHG